MSVFLHYDQKALDAEYNNRAKVKDAMDWIARYGAESARVRAELPMRFDVPFGRHHAERLDVFPASEAGPGPVPVHVFVHGGYWHRLDKADFSFVARAFREAVTIVVNYALVPTVDLDELVRQVRASVAWVHANARSFGGDPARITVSGHSAGGHLVAMLLATDWPQFGVPADVVKAGCAVSGLYDLEPIRLCYLNDVLGLTLESARRNDQHDLQRRPHVRLQQMAAARLAVGASDDDVRVDLRLALVERDVAEQREHLHLLVKRDLLVVALRAVEIAQRHVAERADGREVRGAELLRLGEGREPGHRLVALVEDQRPGPGAGGVEQAGLHR